MKQHCRNFFLDVFWYIVDGTTIYPVKKILLDQFQDHDVLINEIVIAIDREMECIGFET